MTHLERESEIELAEISEEQRARARRVVAGYAADAAECHMFLEMLGLTDKPETAPGECVECGDPLPITARARRVGYAGRCSECRKGGDA